MNINYCALLKSFTECEIKKNKDEVNQEIQTNLNLKKDTSVILLKRALNNSLEELKIDIFFSLRKGNYVPYKFDEIYNNKKIGRGIFYFDSKQFFYDFTTDEFLLNSENDLMEYILNNLNFFSKVDINKPYNRNYLGGIYLYKSQDKFVDLEIEEIDEYSDACLNKEGYKELNGDLEIVEMIFKEFLNFFNLKLKFAFA